MVGFNEIALGIPVPYLVDMMLRQVVGDRSATNMMYRGKLMSPEKAKDEGLVDMVCGSDELEDEAIKNTAKIAFFQSQAFMNIKANRVEDVISKFEKNHKKTMKYLSTAGTASPYKNCFMKRLKNFKYIRRDFYPP